MTLVRDIVAEAIKALAVLALVFLSFAHQPLDLPLAGEEASGWTLADTSYCGDGPEGEGAGHYPCHACRAGVADLPPVPCVSEPAYVALSGDGFALSDAVWSVEALVRPGNPRAPPAVV